MVTAILKVTPNAQQKIKELLQKHPNKIGLSIGLKKGGCAGMEYDLALLDELPLDCDKVALEDLNLFVRRDAVLFLLGTEIDYEITNFRKGFVFHNPNQISACGCGESVMLKSVQDLGKN